MNKQSIIGFVLIFAIFVGYMWWISPSEEERAEMMRKRDSIYQAYNDSLMLAQSLQAEQARIDSLAQAGDTMAQRVLKQREQVLSQAELGRFTSCADVDSMIVHVDNGLLHIDIDNRGAMVQRVVVKDFTTYYGKPLQLISPAADNMNLTFICEDGQRRPVCNSQDFTFNLFIDGRRVDPADTLTLQVSSDDSLTLRFRAFASDSNGVDSNRYLEYAYTIRGNSYQVGFDITMNHLDGVIGYSPNLPLDFTWKNTMLRQEKVNTASAGSGSRNKDPELFYSNIYYKPLGDDVSSLRNAINNDDRVKTTVEWVAFKQQFFCAVLSNADGFTNADMTSTVKKQSVVDSANNYLCDMQGVVGIAYDGSAAATTHMSFYYGPAKYHELKTMHRGYEKMLPLGMWIFSRFVSRYVIIPVFNFLETFNWNYGIIVLVLTFLMRLVLFPLTYKSYRSSAVMRILKPEMDALNKKYPNQEQMMQKQQEMSRLQKRAGINPIAGCLPMLVQLPILTAMFWFFPTSIELRQKGFLWCDDLSTYDSVVDLGFTVPLGFGDHISLFCLLMFCVQFFYTWYTMRSQSGQMSMPGMKFMMYFMPFMMLFLFNSQSAALNLYYFTSLSITMAQMILIRRFTSEQKVRAHMAAYDLKHKNGTQKKSKFQQRLEEMQRMSEQMQKQNAQRRK